MKNEILAIDIGNTSTFFAHFSGEKIQKTYRAATSSLRPGTVHLLRKRFALKNIQAAIISSVVPHRGRFLQKEIGGQLKIKTRLLGKDIDVPIKNNYKNPKQVGVDRLVNAVAAFELVRHEAIVIDFGTAITFDIVSRKGEYLGGVIAPGIEISLEALYSKTALLPKIRLAHPRHLIGKDTIESIRVGCAVGMGGLCDRIVDEIRAKYRLSPTVIATGGYASFMKRYCRSIELIKPFLTMRGILLSYKKAIKNS